MRRWLPFLLLTLLAPGLWASIGDMEPVPCGYDSRNGSADPAGYVDGYGLYNGYFVPNATDPEGKFLLAMVFLTIAIDLDIQVSAANGDIRNINLAQTVSSAAWTLLFGSVFRGFGALPYGNAVGLAASGGLAAKHMQDAAEHWAKLIAESDDAFNDPEIRTQLKELGAQALRDMLLAIVTSKHGRAPPRSFSRSSRSCPTQVQPNQQLVTSPDFASKQLALDHYAKHARGVEIKRDLATGKIKQVKPKQGGADMPEVKNFDDYQTKAKQMWTRNTSSTLEERASGSDRVRYDHETGLFSVLSGGGKIRTCFRPDNGYEWFLTHTD